jgi:hypothetical protein
MDPIVTRFGAGKGLIVLQMGLRALVVFFVALLLIRVSAALGRGHG